MPQNDPARFHEPSLSNPSDIEYRTELEEYYSKSAGSNVEKLENFAKYVPRPVIMRFLCRYEIFKQVLNVQGSIIECGVLLGGSLMTWAQLSTIFEPINHQRKIIGFDTFEGFPSIADEDKSTVSPLIKEGGFGADSFQDLQECMRLYDMNRSLNHIAKLDLVKGDIKNTIPKFLKDNPHTVVSLLHLDADIFKPTETALEYFVPRMPKGAIIVFDELNSEYCPGETIAVHGIGIYNLRIQRFVFGSHISYAVLE